MGRNSTYEELKHTYCEPFRVRVRERACERVCTLVLVCTCLYLYACACMSFHARVHAYGVSVFLRMWF